MRLIDEIGVDITVDIADTLEKPYGRRDRAPEILRKMLDAKLLGRKSGSGFYQYEGKQQTTTKRSQDGAFQLVILSGEARRRTSRSTRAEGRDDLALRLIFLMVNEAARCLEEKVVATPEDADFGMMMGTGFAPFRGGPLRYADHVGIKKVVTEMDGLHSRAGEKFVPCELLRQHAQNGSKFYENPARSPA